MATERFLSIIPTPGQSHYLQIPTSFRPRSGLPCPNRFHLDNPCLPLLNHLRLNRLHSLNQFLLRICSRGRCPLDNLAPADATRTIVFTPGTSPFSSPGLERCPNQRSRKIVWTHRHQLRRYAKDRAMMVCEQGSDSVGCRPRPTAPSLLRLHLGPALREEAIITNTLCPITFSRSSNQGRTIPTRHRRPDPRQQVPL